MTGDGDPRYRAGVRLRLEIPESWQEKSGAPKGVRVVEPAPGVTVTIEPLRALPRELRAWGDEVVMAGVDPTMYRVRNVDDLHTVRGWPVTIFFSDITSMLPESPTVLEGHAHAPQLYGGSSFTGAGSPSGPRVLQRRLHALYLFDEYCGVASARSADLARFDALLPELRRVLLTGEPDWTDGRAASIVSLFDGMSVFRAPVLPEDAAPQKPDQVK